MENSLTLSLSPHCCASKTNLLRLVYHVHEDTVPQWLEDASADDLMIGFPAVLLWGYLHPEQRDALEDRLEEIASTNDGLKLALACFAFANGDMANAKDNTPQLERVARRPVLVKSKSEFGEPYESTMDLVLSEEDRNAIHLVSGEPPAKKAQKYDADGTKITHPFTGDVVDRVELKKEFTSNAKPSWVRFHDSEGHVLSPDAVAKYGDDLRKDQAVQLIFNAMEAIWSASDAKFRLGTPKVKTYQVLPTAADAGYIEFVPGKTVKEVEALNEWKDVDLRTFAPSAVGSYVAGFVLGVRDRHSENWMLVGDQEKPELMQIDFGYMLMENPGGAYRYVVCSYYQSL